MVVEGMGAVELVMMLVAGRANDGRDVERGGDSSEGGSGCEGRGGDGEAGRESSGGGGITGGGGGGVAKVGGGCNGSYGEAVTVVVEQVELIWEKVLEAEEVIIVIESVDVEVVVVEVEMNMLMVEVVGGGSSDGDVSGGDGDSGGDEGDWWRGVGMVTVLMVVVGRWTWW